MAEAVLLDGNEVLILGSGTLLEQLNIDVMEGLKAKELRSGEMETSNQVVVFKVETTGYVSARQVSVSISAEQRVVDCKEAILARGKTIKMESEHDHMLPVEALTTPLEQTAQKGMPLELQQEI